MLSDKEIYRIKRLGRPIASSQAELEVAVDALLSDRTALLQQIEGLEAIKDAAREVIESVGQGKYHGAKLLRLRQLFAGEAPDYKTFSPTQPSEKEPPLSECDFNHI
jgi:hypothetical protein